MNASPTRRPNGDGMYWFNGFAQGRNGPSAEWRITPDINWSTISIDYNVLDSRMEGPGGRNADPTNQRWVFQRISSGNNGGGGGNNGGGGGNNGGGGGNNGGGGGNNGGGGGNNGGGGGNNGGGGGNNGGGGGNNGGGGGNNGGGGGNNGGGGGNNGGGGGNNSGGGGGGNNSGGGGNNGGGGGNSGNGPRGKTFEDLWFTLTPQDAAKEEYDIIVVGTGMGAGVIAGDLFDTDSKVGHRAKSVLVIEKGGVPFHSHCFNAARPIGFGEDRGQQNDTFFSLFKQNYAFKDETQAREWNAGEMFNLGGRGAAWGLFSPRIHDETLEKEFGTDLRQQLVGEWYRKAEDLMGLFNPKTSSYHASLMERLNMVSGRGCQWQWGRIASEFQDDRNFDFARGAYSPIDKLLEIAMSKDRDSKTGKTIEHKNFKILIHSDVRSLERDPNKDDVYSGVWVRDRSGMDTLIKLKDNGKIILGAGSVGSPTILMRTNAGMADFLQGNGGLHLTDHDIFAATATFGYLDMAIQDKVGAMKLQTYVRLKSNRIALLNVAVGASSFLPRTSFPKQRRFTNLEFPRMIAAFIFPEPLLQTNTIELNPAPPRNNLAKRRDTEPVVNAGRRQPFNSSAQDRGDIVDLRTLTKSVFKTLQDELKLCDMCVLDPDGAQIEVTDDKFFKALELGGVAHELGTIPMQNGSNSLSSSCLDQNLKLRNTANVYVCDLSIFPFSPEVNPTLTLVALALRLSRHIHDPRIIDTKGDNSVGSTMTTAQAQVRRWVMNQSGDPVKVHISNLSGTPTTTKFVDGKQEADSPPGETILEPGAILEVERDNKTDETVRVYTLRFGIDWNNWKKNNVPGKAFVTRPIQYIARPQKVCAIE
ncbi:hypothetical protein H0H92_015932 [Tricholoma furcatifolium]|nr:hypothetical protein H0H92_015932 [Tricholoma furcatifolium]